MLIRYLIDDAFLDAVDDLVEAVRDLPRTSVLGLTSTLTDLQAKRQKVQDMMDDGFYDIDVPELKESDQDEDSR
ncbi:hypothetical protein ACTUHY_00540 [Acidaminococcus sp. LBK-2]|uniref:hypothetical protein n=1 Tax=Acidaminococcus sp. LBK-2 TaxID=3456956 RepID=UPI003FA45306